MHQLTLCNSWLRLKLSVGNMLLNHRCLHKTCLFPHTFLALRQACMILYPPMYLQVSHRSCDLLPGQGMVPYLGQGQAICPCPTTTKGRLGLREWVCMGILALSLNSKWRRRLLRGIRLGNSTLLNRICSLRYSLVWGREVVDTL